MTQMRVSSIEIGWMDCQEFILHIIIPIFSSSGMKITAQLCDDLYFGRKNAHPILTSGTLIFGGGACLFPYPYQVQVKTIGSIIDYLIKQTIMGGKKQNKISYSFQIIL